MFQITSGKACAGVAMIAAAFGLTQLATAESPSKTHAAKNVSVRGGSDLQCGTKLIGMDVKNTSGEKLGTVKEIVLDAQHDRIDYVALSYGGAAGIGDRTIAVPWSEFQVASADYARGDASADPNRDAVNPDANRDKSAQGKGECHLALNTTKADLDQVKGFREDSLPAQIGDNWRQEQMAEQPALKRTDAEKLTFDSRRLSKLIGSEVRSGSATPARAEQDTAKADQKPSMDEMGEKVGEIKDAILKSDSGQIAYAFVKLDNIEGHNGDMSTVPWSALMVHNEPKIHAMLQAPKTTLATFAFKSNQEEEQLARLAERDYSREIFTAYDQGPQWEALGFVSPGQEGTSQRDLNRDKPASTNDGKTQPNSGDSGRQPNTQPEK